MNQLKESLWGKVLNVPVDNHFKLELGALSVSISHLHHEWQFRHAYSSLDESISEKKAKITPLKQISQENKELMRFIHSGNNHELKFVPRLANRPIVAKPHIPVYLPAKQSITIYVSTPVWLSIFVKGELEPLLEIPSFKLADTWFGAKPHIGELCYASRFSGRTNLELLPKRTSRIITPVNVVNNGKDNLKLEKIAIPTNYLSVHTNEKDELWTPTLKVMREAEKKNTLVSIERTGQSLIEHMKKIAEPRVSDESGLISKTIDTLFS